MTLLPEKVKVLSLTLALGIAALLTCERAEAAAQETLIVAGGCFWCVEADFEKVRGVEEVVSGYTGGTVPNPTYKQVTAGGTGHYEAVEIRFDPAQVSRASLINLFLRSVDPTDAGGQFCDRGASYRTAIFAQDASEAELARSAVASAEKEIGQTIVTPILNAGPFYGAEEYHQDYYKSSDRVLTRFGYVAKKDAYKRYREGCGRDQRIRSIWGDDAPFVGG
ncbi:peptide-methionine (S)-S-oxide reductase [Poseidonocella pacifica]|uniref:Peptide methionine sulfoxide reductase MsrA n=1 Tax=Poseidonocella pacifica TaxID=871651 RepID=A0A1I0XWC8_9RHOB|nr:peptide-methionine (S)-S-oxide reductase MsrA [Poseidonocella pacifica]SFB04967.1 peptide-methionine (S)-S-oxide reductase [Poseidonocella pacifica]